MCVCVRVATLFSMDSVRLLVLPRSRPESIWWFTSLLRRPCLWYRNCAVHACVTAGGAL